MIYETSWQWNQALPLTCCWSWDKTRLMRLPGKEIKQCHCSLAIGHGWDILRLPGEQIKQSHSQAVGHVMSHDWWDSLAKGKSSVTHILLVIGWEIIVEIAWTEIKQCNTQAFGQGMRHDWWDYLERKQSSVTHILFVMDDLWDCQARIYSSATHILLARNETWLMRQPGKEIKQFHHSLAVGYGMRHDWIRNKAVSLTCCWSWDNWWGCLGKK